MISIVIPTYDREKLIIETLDSISNQSYKNWECIIVDDGSTDNSLQSIREYTKNDSRFTVYERPQSVKKGASACRNFGFEQAKGTHIQFFDSDDIMHPEHLNSKITAIDDADFVVCKLREFEKEFDAKLFSERHSDAHLTYEANVFDAFVTGRFPMMMVAPMWKKESLAPYMPIREDLTILEDHELFARALFDAKKYKVVDKTLIFCRIALTSLTNSFYGNLSKGIDSYFEAKKTVLRLSNTPEIKLAILKMTLGFFRLGLAQKNYREAEKCLDFIKMEKLCYSSELKRKVRRIHLFYLVFKFVGRGDTKYKSLLKL